MRKVVIIGAGPAGLTAASELSKAGNSEYSITVLEESKQVGGISKTVNHNGNRMDLGGHRFFSKDKNITKWWSDRLAVQSSPAYDDLKLGRAKEYANGNADPEKQDDVFLIRDRVSRIYYLKKFFDYPISMKPQTFINMGFSRTAKAGASYIASCIHKREETNLENFYINRFGKVLYSMFFEAYTEKLWGRHPSAISADWGAQRVKGLSVTAIIKDIFSIKGSEKETSLIERFYYPKYGPGQLWEKVAEEAENSGVNIIKNAKAVGINRNDGKISSVVYNQDGETKEIDCDILISSMPVKDLVEAMNFDVPSEVKRIAAGLPYRDFVTVGLLVDKLNLKNETKIKTLSNIIPDCWIYVQEANVKLGRIQIFNNWSPYLVKDPENTVWIGLEYFCNENDSFWNMSEDECAKYAIDELASMGIIEKNQKILDFHREKVKKAYPAYFDTYSEIQTVIDYIDSLGNLYCIGRNGQHRYNNMDHSMATAFEAVKAITENKADKTAIWSVNTEKKYHEKAE